MAKLTKAQQELLLRVQKTKSLIYFTRDKKDFERCYIGSKRVSSRVFFFFFDIGYFDVSEKITGRKYEYYYMSIKHYKLEEYINDFKQPFVIPE